MTTTQAKSDKAKAKAMAKSELEGYHEGNTVHDKLLRKQILLHILICITTSDWYLANNAEMRSGMIHFIVQVDDTMDALDEVHN